MRLLCVTIFLLLLPRIVHGGDVLLQTAPLLESPLYDKARVEREVIHRIRTGIYEGYEAELCVDDPADCNSDAFRPYRLGSRHVLKIQQKSWDDLPSEVKNAAFREIISSTWGHPKRNYSPLDVVIKGDSLGASPLSHLSPKSAERYLRFAQNESLSGGVGINAYGPNCWFNAISAIADGCSAYARAQMLTPAVWNKARFMGPTEFRLHMTQFTQVEAPQFGDIIRYYTDEPIYGGFHNLVYGGEVHAAVYVGQETCVTKEGQTSKREVALTKNGRSDLDFLIFQDVCGLDEAYLSQSDSSAVVPESQKIKKGYFRVRRGAALLDPAHSGRLSGAHSGYLVDIKNYTDRWLCLAKLIDPPTSDGKNCYSYPQEWMTLPSSVPKPTAPETLPLKVRPAPLLKSFGPQMPPGVLKAKASG